MWAFQNCSHPTFVRLMPDNKPASAHRTAVVYFRTAGEALIAIELMNHANPFKDERALGCEWGKPCSPGPPGCRTPLRGPVGPLCMQN